MNLSPLVHSNTSCFSALPPVNLPPSSFLSLAILSHIFCFTLLAALQNMHNRLSLHLSRYFWRLVFSRSILLTEITAAQNEVALSYHIVRGLYFLTVIFVTTIINNSPVIASSRIVFTFCIFVFWVEATQSYCGAA